MLIKPKELATAWNLFKETNSADFSGAFTREGRSSIRLIKMKLDEDDDLSAYIQRYLAKVEDLVREAYASNDENALHAYMVSPSGKVYTLLAYASERI